MWSHIPHPLTSPLLTKERGPRGEVKSKDGYFFLVIYDENKIKTRLEELKLQDNLYFLKDYQIIYLLSL